MPTNIDPITELCKVLNEQVPHFRMSVQPFPETKDIQRLQKIFRDFPKDAWVEKCCQQARKIRRGKNDNWESKSRAAEKLLRRAIATVDHADDPTDPVVQEMVQVWTNRVIELYIAEVPPKEIVKLRKRMA